MVGRGGGGGALNVRLPLFPLIIFFSLLGFVTYDTCTVPVGRFWEEKENISRRKEG